ncbi:glycerol-3-phosphate 1-O-acyltransferase PlsY [Sulfitobacter sp. CW3]|jgi:glycerol-3-phosphate acyltransferase PlsY|uniref:glycerol-3-phosphate 1-O-acyltransferase PlsY n=1 Tax=unclassified Sulfitobacter TaxID=196795 RepID=UPI001A073E4C|nr:glycerol-3-phosphate 1-O-acyltransferase PlsY [Sulfitobacter sp. CW3]MBW4961958.1 glycerol-3-phosphate 1-O-acyltransferase PlsY [Sulfitobacter sp. CW3]NOR30263.1 glycerol-3-phosphate 1-O-acyltransferase PlsY [Sulfitobacter sp.]|tara:strand:- start:63435 stop:64046 length:612 start_codon:yes stop_codon:yes gene_type:complete
MPIIDSSLAVLSLWAVLGYLIGSIAFGLLLARAMNLGDLRTIGSGNIGATNVLRTGNKTAAALTLLLDGAKGAVAVLLARFFAGEDAAQIAGLAAMIGHCYPVWLKFKGGKGVATFLGVILALAWPAGLACCLAWLIGALVTRISSMGAIAAASTSTVFLLVLGYGSAFFLGVLLTLLIFWRHRENIKRIRAGTEPKIGAKKA